MALEVRNFVITASREANDGVVPLTCYKFTIFNNNFLILNKFFDFLNFLTLWAILTPSFMLRQVAIDTTLYFSYF